MSIRHMKKEDRNTRFPSLLFLCTEQLTYTSLFPCSHDRAAYVTQMQRKRSVRSRNERLCSRAVVVQRLALSQMTP